jgi:hypothetical protein
MYIHIYIYVYVYILYNIYGLPQAEACTCELDQNDRVAEKLSETERQSALLAFYAKHDASKTQVLLVVYMRPQVLPHARMLCACYACYVCVRTPMLLRMRLHAAAYALAARMRPSMCPHPAAHPWAPTHTYLAACGHATQVA